MLFSAGCLIEVQYSLFLCLIDSFSPSVIRGKRFLDCVLTFVIGKHSP